MITSPQKDTTAMHTTAPRSATNTQTQHYSIRHIHSTKHHDNYRKIKVAHHGITIRGVVPAFGRCSAAAATSDLAVDLYKIVLVVGRGRFAWC